MGNWIQCNWNDIPLDNEPYKLIPHSIITNKRTPWLKRCKYCGLVLLNNRFSLWSKKVGCENRKHPQYKAQWNLSGP